MLDIAVQCDSMTVLSGQSPRDDHIRWPIGSVGSQSS